MRLIQHLQKYASYRQLRWQSGTMVIGQCEHTGSQIMKPKFRMTANTGTNGQLKSGIMTRKRSIARRHDPVPHSSRIRAHQSLEAQADQWGKRT
jgi:hypothetical protein